MVLLDMLEDLDFLRGTPPEHLGHLAALGQLQEHPAGTVLFREGEVSHHVYLVHQGEVLLEVQVPGRGPAPIQTVGPGELLGWSPVLRLGPMTATARTLSRCRLVALDAGPLLALCQRDPAFGLEFLRRTAAAIGRRLHGTRLRLLAQTAGQPRP
jgi:CRP-like cAMP-binding protein